MENVENLDIKSLVEFPRYSMNSHNRQFLQQKGEIEP